MIFTELCPHCQKPLKCQDKYIKNQVSYFCPKYADYINKTTGLFFWHWNTINFVISYYNNNPEVLVFPLDDNNQYVLHYHFESKNITIVQRTQKPKRYDKVLITKIEIPFSYQERKKVLNSLVLL